MTPMLTAIAAAALISSGAATTANNSPKPSKAAPAQAQNEPKYCISYENVTGSRVAQQECKTKAQWAKEGVDIEHPSGS